MNNIYVETMPENCLDCKFCGKRNYCCILMQKDVREFRDECPLALLSDRLAEERKKVVQSLKDKIEKRNNGTRNGNYSEQYKDGYSGCCCDLTEILDQIERN